jgi:hypothetical protein
MIKKHKAPFIGKSSTLSMPLRVHFLLGTESRKHIPNVTDITGRFLEDETL